jgi:sphingomyelin phosphodiesterase acid-like 3
MKRYLAVRTYRAISSRHIALLCCVFFACAAYAQSVSPTSTNQGRRALQAAPFAKDTQRAKETISVLMVSDIHFDPFWDPAKVQQLAAAPVSEWNPILASAPSTDREQRFAALLQTCHARGADTSYPLLESSLKAMSNHASGAKFVTMAGDLLSHAFQCKYNTLFPRSTPDGYKAFVEKTMSFVIAELNSISAGLPVYVALGNNDSDCGDYRQDADGEFLAVTGKLVTDAVPVVQRPDALETFAAGGYYSVPLPAPIQNTRLLVLNDLFMSSNYSTCAGKADPAAADAQLAWLQKQLDEARVRNQNVWVMGHIPPGIDAYASMARMINPCGRASPRMFLSSEKLADVLTDNSDVVRLALFAHTHMDEIRLLRAEPAALYPTAPGTPMIDAKGFIAEPRAVALKTIPSISPIDGNNPAFTVAQVDPATATLVDYRVIAAADLTGSGQWTEEYDYSRAYSEPFYSASSVNQLLTRFAADFNAQSKASQSYLRNYLVGGGASVLVPFWPQYVCTLTHHTAAEFGACACPTAH